MKRFIFIAFISMFSFGLNAQIAERTVSLDLNTTLTSIGGFSGLGVVAPGTGFGLYSAEGETVWSIGGEMGYFVAENFALKVGLGYTDLSGDGFFSYRVGGKYYVVGKIPFQLDYTGQSGDNVFFADPSFIGLQGGYAIFLGEMVALEPSLRYSISLEDLYDDVFQIQLGFSIFL